MFAADEIKLETWEDYGDVLSYECTQSLYWNFRVHCYAG